MLLEKNRSDELSGMAAKVASVHGSKDPALIELKDVVNDLLELESAEEDAEELARLLEKARALTHNFELPDWACRTVQRYFGELSSINSELSA